MSLWKSRRNKCCFNYLQLAWVKLIKHSLWLLTCANWCWMCHYWDSLTKFNIYYYESFASIIDDNNCSFFYLQKLLMSMPGEIIWFKRLILGSKLNSRLQRWVDWVVNLNYQFILGLFIRTSLRQHIRHALWHLILIWVLVHCRVGWLNSSVIIEYCLNLMRLVFLWQQRWSWWLCSNWAEHWSWEFMAHKACFDDDLSPLNSPNFVLKLLFKKCRSEVIKWEYLPLQRFMLIAKN